MPQQHGDHMFETGAFFGVRRDYFKITDVGLEPPQLIHCPSFRDLRPALGSGAFL